MLLATRASLCTWASTYPVHEGSMRRRQHFLALSSKDMVDRAMPTARTSGPKGTEGPSMTLINEDLMRHCLAARASAIKKHGQSRDANLLDIGPTKGAERPMLYEPYRQRFDAAPKEQ